jgi:hypothetical protein
MKIQIEIDLEPKEEKISHRWEDVKEGDLLIVKAPNGKLYPVTDVRDKFEYINKGYELIYNHGGVDE